LIVMWSMKLKYGMPTGTAKIHKLDDNTWQLARIANGCVWAVEVTNLELQLLSLMEQLCEGMDDQEIRSFG